MTISRSVFEEWRPVVGYEGRYEVSNLGNVRSLPTAQRATFLILRPAAQKSGHLAVSLWMNGSGKTHQVHTLVLEAFVGPRPGHYNKWHGCHGDGDPANNCIDNLRWDTRSSNEMDKVEHGRSNRGIRNRSNKLTEAQAKEIKERLALKIDSHSAIARDYGVKRETITAISLGRSWSWL